jgi:hypothetical protein
MFVGFNYSSHTTFYRPLQQNSNDFDWNYGLADRFLLIHANQTEKPGHLIQHDSMKNKVLRFVVYSVVMISSLYLAFMLLDMKKANASEKTGENLLLSAGRLWKFR